MRFVAAALIAVALTGAASAQSVETVEIEFRASDLTQVERLDALRDRIRLAAIEVCNAHTVRTLADQRDVRACVEDAIRNSESQLTMAVARANGVVEMAAEVR